MHLLKSGDLFCTKYLILNMLRVFCDCVFSFHVLIPNFSCLLFKVFLTLNFMYVTAQDKTVTGEDNNK